jgi:hypothetical protein
MDDGAAERKRPIQRLLYENIDEFIAATWRFVVRFVMRIDRGRRQTTSVRRRRRGSPDRALVDQEADFYEHTRFCERERSIHAGLNVLAFCRFDPQISANSECSIPSVAAGPRQPPLLAGRIEIIVLIRTRICLRTRHIEELSTKRKFFGAVSIGEQSVIANPMETIRQDMNLRRPQSA